MRQFVTDIAQTRAGDGLTFDTAQITTKAMREDAEYQGVRVTIPAALDTAKIKVQLDLSFGDPVNVEEISYPTLLDDQDMYFNLKRTADHREHPLIQLGTLLDGHGAARQPSWTALRQRAGLSQLPASFEEVVAEVVRFVDPLIRGDGDGDVGVWSPGQSSWVSPNGD